MKNYELSFTTELHQFLIGFLHTPTGTGSDVYSIYLGPFVLSITVR